MCTKWKVTHSTEIDGRWVKVAEYYEETESEALRLFNRIRRPDMGKSHRIVLREITMRVIQIQEYPAILSNGETSYE